MPLTRTLVTGVLRRYDDFISRIASEMIERYAVVVPQRTRMPEAPNIASKSQAELVRWLMKLLSPYLPEGYFGEGGAQEDPKFFSSKERINEVLQKAYKTMFDSLQMFLPKAIMKAMQRDYSRVLYRLYYKQEGKAPQLITGFTENRQLSDQGVRNEFLNNLNEAGETELSAKVNETPLKKGRSKDSQYFYTQTVVHPVHLADVGISTSSPEGIQRLNSMISKDMLIYFTQNKGELERVVASAYGSMKPVDEFEAKLDPGEPAGEGDGMPASQMTDTGEKPANLESQGRTDAVFEPKRTRSESEGRLRGYLGEESNDYENTHDDVLSWLRRQKRDGKQVQWEYVRVHVGTTKGGYKKLLEFKLPEYSDDEIFMIAVPDAIGLVRSRIDPTHTEVKPATEEDIEKKFSKGKSYTFDVVEVGTKSAVLDFADFRSRDIKSTLDAVKEGDGLTADQLTNVFKTMTQRYVSSLVSLPTPKLIEKMEGTVSISGQKVPTGEGLAAAAMDDVKEQIQDIMSGEKSYVQYRHVSVLRTQEERMQEQHRDVIGDATAAVLQGMDRSSAYGLAKSMASGLPERPASKTFEAAFITRPFVEWLLWLILDRNSPVRPPRKQPGDTRKRGERIPWAMMLEEVFKRGILPQEPEFKPMLKYLYQTYVYKEKKPTPEQIAELERFTKSAEPLSADQLKEISDYMKAKASTVIHNVVPRLSSFLEEKFFQLVKSGDYTIKRLLQSTGPGLRGDLHGRLEIERQDESRIEQGKERLQEALLEKDRDTVEGLTRMLSNTKGFGSMLDSIDTMTVTPGADLRSQPKMTQNIINDFLKKYDEAARGQIELERTRFFKQLRTKKKAPPARSTYDEVYDLGGPEEEEPEPAYGEEDLTTKFAGRTASLNLYKLLKSGHLAELSGSTQTSNYKYAVHRAYKKYLNGVA